MRSIVHFGAGNIGRSLVGSLFSAAGYEVVFVDVARDIIQALNDRRAYEIHIKDRPCGGAPSVIRVENLRGIHASEEDKVVSAIASANIISTAVGQAVLPKIMPVLAKGIMARTTPVSILFCENIHDACKIAREGLKPNLPEGFPLDERVGLVRASIGKMVPIMPDAIRTADPLLVWAERYNKIIADADGLRGEKIEVPGLEFHRNFDAHLACKLFIHNLGHAVCAYYGHLCGLELIADCVEKPWIRAEAGNSMRESANAILAAYPGVFTGQELDAHVEDLLQRFANKALGDTVFRVGRDLTRKLAPNDRLAGALRLCAAHGKSAASICRGIAAALCFHGVDENGFPFPGDVAFHKSLARQGVERMLLDICGLGAEDGQAVSAIRLEYEKLNSLRQRLCA